MRKLLRHRSRNKKMVVVLDNARHHHAKLLKPLLEKHEPISNSCFCRRTAPGWHPSSESGNSREGWQRTIGTSPTWTNCKRRLSLASAHGGNPILCCEDYAALFRSLCLVGTRIG